MEPAEGILQSPQVLDAIVVAAGLFRLEGLELVAKQAGLVPEGVNLPPGSGIRRLGPVQAPGGMPRHALRSRPKKHVPDPG